MDDQDVLSVTVPLHLVDRPIELFFLCNYTNLKDTAGQSAPLHLAPSDHLHRKEGVL